MVVGIGVAPVTDWLAGSGLELRDGVVADAALAAGPPGVFAAGDVVRWHHELLGEEVRLEHWTNAAEQGAAAARNLLATAAGGDATPYQAVPFFWSDQYDARIQCLGRPDPGDEVAHRARLAGRAPLRRPLRPPTGGCGACSASACRSG